MSGNFSRLSYRTAAQTLGGLLVLTFTAANPARAQTIDSARPLTLGDYYRMGSVGSPAISPDGNYVAYVRTAILEDENRSHSGIWLRRSDASDEARRLTNSAFNASNPRWSPDGSLLAFTSARPTGSIWFLRMDQPSGEAFQIEGVEGSPVFSPDNEWIAFTKPTMPEVREQRTYASDFERQIDERFDGTMYDWMNYRFDRRGYLPDPRDPSATPPSEVYVVSRDGGAPRQLTHLGVNAQGLAWRPDGQALALTADAHQRDEHTYERADLWIVDLETTTTPDRRRVPLPQSSVVA